MKRIKKGEYIVFKIMTALVIMAVFCSVMPAKHSEHIHADSYAQCPECGSYYVREVSSGYYLCLEEDCTYSVPFEYGVYNTHYKPVADFNGTTPPETYPCPLCTQEASYDRTEDNKIYYVCSVHEPDGLEFHLRIPGEECPFCHQNTAYCQYDNIFYCDECDLDYNKNHPVVYCPECHSSEFIWVSSADYFICHNSIHSDQVVFRYDDSWIPSQTPPQTPPQNDPVTEQAPTEAPEPVIYSVTYEEYKSENNPSLSSRTVSVYENTYYQLSGSTVSEYRDADGGKYTFTGRWLVNGTEYSDGSSFPVMSDVTISPVYDVSYAVTYLDDDRRSTFMTFEVAAGEYHRIISEYPEKAEDEKYKYEFEGWTFNDSVVTGYQLINFNKFYYPSYKRVLKTNVITFLDADGNSYNEVTVNTGSEFSIPQEGPEKEATETIGYEFAGWTVNGEAASGSMKATADMTFTPSYTEYEIVVETPEEEVAEEPEEQDNGEAVPNPEDIDADGTDTPGGAPQKPTPEPTPEVTQEPEPTAEPVNDTPVVVEEEPVITEAETESVEVIEEIGEEEEIEDLEDLELDLEEQEVPKGAIAVAGAGTAVLVVGAAVAIAKAAGGATAASAAAGAAGKAAAGTAKVVKAGKAAKTAAKAADAATKAKAIRDLEFESKTILLAADDSDLNTELKLLFGKKKFVSLKTTKATDPASIASTARKIKANMVIIDTLKKESAENFKSRVETICPKGSDYKLTAISNDAYTSVDENTFKSLKASGNLADYTSAGVSGSQKLVHLVLPVYKPEITVENSAEFIGRVTDALGIPVVSNVIELFVNGKEIKETLSSKNVDVSDISTVVGNIASIFGLDAVEDVSKLINGIDTAKDVIKTEDVTDV